MELLWTETPEGMSRQKRGQNQRAHFMIMETILGVRTSKKGIILITHNYVTCVFLKVEILNTCYLLKLNSYSNNCLEAH